MGTRLQKANKQKEHFYPQYAYFLVLGYTFDNRGPLMGSLCVSVSCSVPQALWLTAALTLIRSMLPFSAMQQPVKHITDTATPWETPTAFVQTHEYYPSLQVALKVPTILESKPGNREHKGQRYLFPPWVKCHNKNSYNCSCLSVSLSRMLFGSCHDWQAWRFSH